jgi:hypothetical protein
MNNHHAQNQNIHGRNCDPRRTDDQSIYSPYPHGPPPQHMYPSLPPPPPQQQQQFSNDYNMQNLLAEDYSQAKFDASMNRSRLRLILS